MSGFRFALVLPDGEPADAAVFSRIIPTWNVGDTFLGGTDLVRFRIVAIEPEDDEEAEFHALWVVEPARAAD